MLHLQLLKAGSPLFEPNLKLTTPSTHCANTRPESLHLLPFHHPLIEGLALCPQLRNDGLAHVSAAVPGSCHPRFWDCTIWLLLPHDLRAPAVRAFSLLQRLAGRGPPKRNPMHFRATDVQPFAHTLKNAAPGPQRVP